MGCDVHFYVEKKVDAETVALTGPNQIGVVSDPTGEHFVWELADKLTPNTYKLHYEEALKKEGTLTQEAQAELDSMNDLDVDYADRYYRGRNYDLFAMLADVRNYGAIEPIDDARGLPEDVCDWLREESDSWGIDAHSHTYFTLRELLEVDWFGNTIEHEGWVTANRFDAYRRFGQLPETWVDNVPKGKRGISNEELTQLIESKTVATFWNGGARADVDADAYLTELTWGEPWSVAAGEFMTTLVKLAQLAVRECDGRLDDVRAVLWFDN